MFFLIAYYSEMDFSVLSAGKSACNDLPEFDDLLLISDKKKLRLDDNV